MSQSKDPQLICEQQQDPRTKKHLLVCSLNVRRQAGKHISDPIKLLIKGNYRTGRGRLHKVLDGLGLTVLLVTLAALVYLVFPNQTPDLITIHASVAPAQITTGDLSTLTFRYENNSQEPIHNSQIHFELPEYFNLEAIETSAEQIGQQTFNLGSIAPTEYGFIHLTGTMFGSVNEDQTFTTSLTYTYGDDHIEDTKVETHLFHPEKSALALELYLPDHLVAYQHIEGQITYTNTGSIPFPKLIIKPEFPESFSLSSSSPALHSDGVFYVDGIKPGQTGVIEFSGTLGSEHDSLFTFSPSFIFDSIQYSQTVLSDSIHILPTPLQLTHSITNSSIVPGEPVTIELLYENISDYSLSDIQISITSDPDIFTTTGIQGGYYENGSFVFNQDTIELEPMQREIASMTISTNAAPSLSQTTDTEYIFIDITSTVEFLFTLNDEEIQVKTAGSSTQTPLTSPVNLSAFGRYWGPSGDQLGRGPIPPTAGQTTKYWIFWNIYGTTNDLSNIALSADLGDNVELTGRQSVSTGSSVTEKDGTITWSIDQLSPTHSSSSAIVGIAFEVALTPEEDQIGTTPILLKSTTLTAIDHWTGEFVMRGQSGVTTSIPYDTKANSYGGIVEE